ncbi:MAG: hypothetical protein NZ908_00525 [Candidatus Micrarchaeota archaeon]|nr:hypothetical protein [Candidatus Micrarchaeota archaeon]MCX8154548.1 hypothetical protein [Candidatus Micrarchaeota archaeon]
MITTINTVSSTILFILLLVSNPSDRVLVFLASLALYIFALINSIGMNQPYWELQHETVKIGILDGLLMFGIGILTSLNILIYLGLFRMFQSILSHLFFEIYRRLL